MTTPRPRYHSFVHDSARWDGFEFRKGDIIISTPPKCGTTWMQRICSLLIFQDPNLERPLSDYSPWLDMLIRSKEDVFRILDAQTNRRFIKTHTQLDGLPMDERVTYICVGRDPRDAAVSFDYHFANINMEAFFKLRATVVDPGELEINMPPMPETLEGRFWMWVHDPRPVTDTTASLAGAMHHYTLALGAIDQPNVVVTHYADLKKDLNGEMRRIAGRLGIDISEKDWPALVEAATFKSMKEHADSFAPDAKEHIWQSNSEFFHRGTGGEWRSFFDDAAEARYDARVAEVASPHVAKWAHKGFLGGA